jgi:hypothetical protein
MDWNAAMEEDRRALRRIVALLFALAGLADRLCSRSRPVRGLVLAILGYAETIARDFVIDTALEQGAPLAPELFRLPALLGGDSAADAMRLASAFRMLGTVLDRLADGEPVCRGQRIARLCVALAACVAEGRLSADGSHGRHRFAPSRLAVGRRDSS